MKSELYYACMGMLSAAVVIAAALGVLILWHSEGRVGRWWRYWRGESRNTKRPLARTVRRVK